MPAPQYRQSRVPVRLSALFPASRNPAGPLHANPCVETTYGELDKCRLKCRVRPARPGRGWAVTDNGSELLLYKEQRCGICFGQGGWRTGGAWHVCDDCGGSGTVLTDLGRAVWELSQRACQSVNQSRE